MTTMNKNFENSVSTIVINTGINTQFDHVPSHAELAEIGNTTIKAVGQYLHRKSAKYGDNTKAHIVRTVAVNNGYAMYEDGTIRFKNGKEGKFIMKKEMPKFVKPVNAMNDYLKKSNFPSRKMRNERMLRLREQGYTNEEISRKVGVTYITVLNNIGKQPDVFTEQSREYARIAHEYAKSARKARVEALKQKKIEELKQNLAKAEAERTIILLRQEENAKLINETQEIIRTLETA